MTNDRRRGWRGGAEHVEQLGPLDLRSRVGTVIIVVARGSLPAERIKHHNDTRTAEEGHCIDGGGDLVYGRGLYVDDGCAEAGGVELGAQPGEALIDEEPVLAEQQVAHRM